VVREPLRRWLTEYSKLTHAGISRLSVVDRTYRVFRSFTHIADVEAVIFALTYDCTRPDAYSLRAQQDIPEVVQPQWFGEMKVKHTFVRLKSAHVIGIA
jgi:hypothetical protein